jgi:cytosine permease
MFFIFAAACFAGNCFACFIAANSFSTMLPKVSRKLATFSAISLSAVLAVTGLADHLIGFFGLVGASFGPICGAMAADYLLAGRKWSGPRLGVNWAGIFAWVIGFLVGIPAYIPGLPAAWVRVDNPAGLYSFLAGFAVYWIMAKLGMRPPVVTMEPRPSKVQ